MRTSPGFAANPMGSYVDPDEMIARRAAGMSVDELHRRAFAGEFPPSKPMDPRVLLQRQGFADSETDRQGNSNSIGHEQIRCGGDAKAPRDLSRRKHDPHDNPEDTPRADEPIVH